MAWGLLDQHQANPGMAFDPKYGAVEARAALDALVAQAIGEEAAADVEPRPVCDLPARALLEAAAGASLLVVGARGLGGFHGLLIGSVSQHCLRHASCPVAVVHRSEGAAPTGAEAGRIVVGIDGSAAARRALEWALDEARARTAALDVVYAWHLPHEARVPVATLGMEPDLLEDAARVTLDEAVDGQDTGGLSSPLNRVLAYGRPTPSILERADGADLVVVGSRGRGGFSGLLLGSVSQQVAHHATCPVVVIPHER